MKYIKLSLFIIVFVFLVICPADSQAQEPDTLDLPTKTDTATPKKNVQTQKKKQKNKKTSVEIERNDSDQANTVKTENALKVKEEKDKQEKAKEDDTSYWKSVYGSKNAVDYQNYLDKYPTGLYTIEAWTALNKLKEEERFKAEEAARAEEEMANKAKTDKNKKDDSKAKKSREDEKKKSKDTAKTDTQRRVDDNDKDVIKGESLSLEANDSNNSAIGINKDGVSTIQPLSATKAYTAGVLNEFALSLPEAKYPDAAKKKKVQGSVVVEVIVDGSGKVVSANASRGPDSLQKAAVDAAYQAKFPTTIILGQPTQVFGVIEYNFKLDTQPKKP